MSITAKFTCSSTRTTGYNSYKVVEVSMNAVNASGADNASWSKNTPQGELTMTITNPAAIDAFEAGEEYFLEFTPVKPVSAPAPEGVLPGELPDADGFVIKHPAVSADAGNVLSLGSDGHAFLSAGAIAAAVIDRDFTTDTSPASRAYPNEIQVGDVIDPVPEAGHDGPQYVTAVEQHADGTALDLRPATPEEIASAPTTPSA